MSLYSWLNHLRSALTPRRGQRQRRNSSRAGTHRPSLEVLEDRLTPSFGWDGAYYDYPPPGTVFTPQPPLLADFTSDAILDELSVDFPNYKMAVRPGRGDGTFGDPIITGIYTPNYAALGVADFNGDGRLDVFVAAGVNWMGQFFWQAHLGRGDGTFDSLDSQIFDFNYPFEFPVGAGTVANPATGRTDLVIAGGNNVDYETTYVVLSNNGDWEPPAVPSLSINDVTVTEGNAGEVSATFTVHLFAASAETVTVDYATADGSATAGGDYQAARGTLTFAPGETSNTITVPVNGDLLAEPNETFFVNLSNATNAAIGDPQGIGTIADDEPPLITISDVSRTEGNTGAASATFTVTLSHAINDYVLIPYSTANGTATAGSDYTAASGSVYIYAGWTSNTFTVTVNGDRLPEANETFFVNLSSPTNATLADGQGVGTILDDEPHISISDVTKAEGRKNKSTLFTFTVTLSSAYDEPVTMSYQTVNGTATTGDGDYVARTGTLTFAPGETTKTITIEVKGDSKKEADETFYLDLYGLSSNALFTKNRGVGTILNDD
jgi:Calx-beta domain-containing protein/VCBS repeat protein